MDKERPCCTSRFLSPSAIRKPLFYYYNTLNLRIKSKCPSILVDMMYGMW